MAPIGRNQPCPCGSLEKYKRCCAAQSRPHATPDGGMQWVTFHFADPEESSDPDRASTEPPQVAIETTVRPIPAGQEEEALRRMIKMSMEQVGQVYLP